MLECIFFLGAIETNLGKCLAFSNLREVSLIKMERLQSTKNKIFFNTLLSCHVTMPVYVVVSLMVLSRRVEPFWCVHAYFIYED